MIADWPTTALYLLIVVMGFAFLLGLEAGT